MTCLHVPRSVRIQREQRRADEVPAAAGELHRRKLEERHWTARTFWWSMAAT